MQEALVRALILTSVVIIAHTRSSIHASFQDIDEKEDDEHLLQSFLEPPRESFMKQEPPSRHLLKARAGIGFKACLYVQIRIHSAKLTTGPRTPMIFGLLGALYYGPM